MRAIGCAIISFVLFYISRSLKADCTTWANIKGFFAFLSWVLLAIAIVLVILGL